jgi:hypothetical protein
MAGPRSELGGMTTPDQCLTHLETLVLSKDGNAVVMAEIYVEDLLQTSLKDLAGAARSLGEIQAQLLRRTAPSPVRADISDLLSSHIERLLEADRDRK